MSLNKTQIAVIAGSLVLIVLLLFANTKLLPKEKPANSEHSGPTNNTQAADMGQLIQQVIEELDKDQKPQMKKLDELTRTSADKKTAFENIINKWDSLQQPVAAAYYMEMAAKSSGAVQNWQEAGNRYYASTQFVGE